MVRLSVNIDRALQKFPGVAHGRQQRKPRQKFDGAPRESNRLNLSDSNRASHSIHPPCVSSRSAPLPWNFLDHAQRHQQRKKKRQSHRPAIKRKVEPARLLRLHIALSFLSHSHPLLLNSRAANFAVGLRGSELWLRHIRLENSPALAAEGNLLTPRGRARWW